MKLIFHKFISGIQGCACRSKTKRNICVVIGILGFAVVMLSGFITSGLKSGQSVSDNPSEISEEKQGRPNADNMVYGSYQKKKKRCIVLI